ncbi:hypothetical protein [Nesterenkonia alba]|uniref:hypothetical protein n=1 Tax=Nesterenkonia alba TaxID=515814 RepID=UPI00040C6093|nr:hypothetical protein [Nesterenkonia alba]
MENTVQNWSMIGDDDAEPEESASPCGFLSTPHAQPRRGQSTGELTGKLSG